ncbi:MAG TPA: hypothetical protein DCX06_06255 [Opitutae bacterium]|nr:hypothetical protein [Opitutae bacterium]
MKWHPYTPFVGLLALTALAVLFFFADQPSIETTDSAEAEHLASSEKQTAQAIQTGSPASELDQIQEEPIVQAPQVGEFSPEMQRLVDGIYAGLRVRVQVAGVEAHYVFRPKNITSENFKISSGPSTELPLAYKVFEGRQLLEDGSLARKAKLAVVNDTVSIAMDTDQGSVLIERNEQGEQVARLVYSADPELGIGHTRCVTDGDIAGIQALNDRPPLEMTAKIALGGESEPEPEVAGAWADHNYYRNGSQYDASLKDIIILMVSGSTQTGNSTPSNLSSRAATYFTYAAKTADTYENQLGLRYLLQELVLIPNDIVGDDIEVNTQDSTTQLNAVRDWAAAHRPQSTYKWGHVAGWTNVSSAGGSTKGWAWIGSYGSSSFGTSVQQRSLDWRLHTHELGHNVGANHTNGGNMNSNVSNAGQDFFTENNTAGGGFTAAKEIYDYMSSPSRSYVYGPADLRNAEEVALGVDDNLSTAVNTPVTFNPLTNDQTSVLFGAVNNLRLIEVGQVFPKTAGSASVSNNEITFTPAAGFAGNVWFRYTLSGDVGNNGQGWLHAADVVVTVGGNSSDPGQNPTISTTDDSIATDFSGAIRLNPLLNDEGTGRLWTGDVEARNFNDGSLVTSDGAFRLVGAQLLAGSGTISLETSEMTRNNANAQDNTGYLVYTPGMNEPAQVEIQYTVEDADGNQSTGTIFLNETETVSIVSDLSLLVETEGRLATITITRTGSTVASEWVDFSVNGSVALTGVNSDVAIAGFDDFDASMGMGRITIPAGQSSVSLEVSAMADAINEVDENVTFTLGSLESLLVDASAATAQIEITDLAGIGVATVSEDFDGFSTGTTLTNGWTNENTSPGVWTANSGTTSSSSTGPDNDHTQGDASGTYLYREASGSNNNQQADLTSPTIDLSGLSDALVEFRYHMYGADMGELRVDVFSAGAWNLDVMPALIGEQQDSSEADWGFARFNVSVYTTADFKVRFRGLTGSTFLSDMAIDDFKVGEPATLTTESPTISGQPQSLNLDDGETAYLSVVAQAYPAPTYQWKKDGFNISGATQSVLYFNAVSVGDAGDYSCEVTSGSIVASATATLSVYDESDTDADGLEDGWEQDNFGDLDETASGDPDGDGSTNLEEFTNGTDPNLDEAPNAPTGLVASFGDAEISLNWNDNIDNDFASYTVYRSTTSGAGFSAIQSGVFTSEYLDDTVMNGTEYFYVVTAVDVNSTESAQSNEDSATPIAGTIFVGNVVSGEADNFISNANNWSNGLPLGNQGTLFIDARFDSNVTHDNYWIHLTGGNLSLGNAFSGLKLGSNSVWVMDGASASFSNVRGIAVGADASFTLNIGNADVSANNSNTTVSGANAEITINGGSMTVGRDLIVNNGGILTVNGGTLAGVDRFFTQSFASASNGFFFNGGTISADTFELIKAATVTFGGSNAGSLTLATGIGTGASFDWLTGTQMTMAIPSADEWAATEWAADRLLYNGQNGTQLGKSWAQVTTADGLATGTRFVYDSTTETLSLESVADPDADNDGIADSWETTYFPGQEATIDGTDDSDGDGVFDFFEYLFDSNPTDPTSKGSSLLIAPDQTGTDMVFEWDIKEGFVNGEDYLLELSTSLSPWVPISEVDYTLTTSTANGMTHVELTIPLSFSDNVFLKLIQP